VYALAPGRASLAFPIGLPGSQGNGDQPGILVLGIRYWITFEITILVVPVAAVLMCHYYLRRTVGQEVQVLFLLAWGQHLPGCFDSPQANDAPNDGEPRGQDPSQNYGLEQSFCLHDKFRSVYA
jgi:hypothetical protein